MQQLACLAQPMQPEANIEKVDSKSVDSNDFDSDAELKTDDDRETEDDVSV